MWKLETNTGEIWYYEDNEHEEAKIDSWIFGGILSYIERDEKLRVFDNLSLENHNNRNIMK